MLKHAHVAWLDHECQLYLVPRHRRRRHLPHRLCQFPPVRLRIIPRRRIPPIALSATVSTSNQPQHFVVTGPFGHGLSAKRFSRTMRSSGQSWEDSRSPVSIRPTPVLHWRSPARPARPIRLRAPLQAILNPNFAGVARQNGKWGKGQTWATYNATSPATTTTPLAPLLPAHTSSPAPEATTVAATGPFINPVAPTGQKSILSTWRGIRLHLRRCGSHRAVQPLGPGNYQLDLAMVRSFPLHFSENPPISIPRRMVQRHQPHLFAVASTAVGNANFGDVTTNPNATRKAAQFSARISF